ncbi:MAG: hypothetical protein QM811_10325 [Pirellulales bacterium]
MSRIALVRCTVGLSLLAALNGVAAAQDAAAPVVQTRSLLSIVQDGGYLMYPLVACSFTLLVFTFERFIALRTSRNIPGPFVEKLLLQMQEGQIDKEHALEVCRKTAAWPCA